MSDDVDDTKNGSQSPAATAPPVSGKQRVRRIIDNSRDAQPDTTSSDDQYRKQKGSSSKGKGKRRRGRPPARDDLLGLVDEGQWELWHDPSGEAYATLPVGTHHENWAIRSSRFRSLLIGVYHKATGGAPGRLALEDVQRVLEARAVNVGSTHPIWIRTGEHQNKIYIDLVNDNWEAIEVTGEGWRLVPCAPLKFIRSPQMRALPLPEPGDEIEGLGDYLNLRSEGDFKLVIAWLVSTLLPHGPYPILLINGEAGSSKTTLSRVLRGLVDPNAAPVRSQPRDERDLYVSVWNAWYLGYDNLSGVPEWFSDELCRLATGGGFGTRKLHSDRKEVIFEGMRPVLLNGISDLATRPDLSDRGIGLMLPAIPKSRRRREKTFWAEYEEARPFLFGALLQTLSGALRELPKVTLEELPRMSDFAFLGVAVERALGWPEGSFIEAYEANRSDAILVSLEANPIGQEIATLAKEAGGVWEGTLAELITAIEGKVPEKVRASRAWPKTASAFGSRLRRVMTPLRALGVDVVVERIGKGRTRMVYIRGTPGSA